MRLLTASSYLFINSLLLCHSNLAYCENAISKVCFKDVCVESEIADTQDKREKGLMFRKSLADDSGMLFVFAQESEYAFWMKNMNFPLDLIWINREMKVVDITKKARPCGLACESIRPQAKAKYVLETVSGFADKNQIKIGEEAYFKEAR